MSMAQECPKKRDRDSRDTTWKKGKNASKRFKARERKVNLQAKRMKKPPRPKLTKQTAAGPVKVPGKRRSYVVNDGVEFLTTPSRPWFDIDRLLEQVARLQVDEDGDDLEEVGGDRMELPQRLAVRAATMKVVLPVAKNEVEDTLQGMIKGAVHNGFPMEHVSTFGMCSASMTSGDSNSTGQTHQQK
ncbi:hypothetical protein DYB37_011247 [Aphanomyces astaci]|uniref:Uncharacterized protein n=2 Tax=Aphanomyces astaci TaxID=112090 RepID=A0A3R7C1Q6_APHAT|nr:hypothetical protein DYB37_011247 [Aphanomyces astaci]